MSKLSKRTPLFPARFRRQNHAARAFLAPQRPHVKQPMPPRRVAA